jgi:hypothetical protein
VVAGGIDEYELGILMGLDTANAVSGGLRLIGYDGDLLANEMIG